MNDRSRPLALSQIQKKLSLWAVLAVCAIPVPSAYAQSDWIWSPRQDPAQANYTECFFRKKFTLIRPVKSELFIAAGDRYELYINGELAHQGTSNGETRQLDVNRWLTPGINLIAVRVNRDEGTQVGLAVRLRILESGETRWRSLTTDSTWRTRLQEQPGWESPSLPDLGWLTARSLGDAATIQAKRSGQVPIRKASSAQAAPAPDRAQASAQLGDQAAKPTSPFQLPAGFEVQKVVEESEVDSPIAMAFNEFGKLIVAEERGPLFQIDIGLKPEDPARKKVICDLVSSCQGILPLNGAIYVTGIGEDGLGLYELTDADRNGEFEKSRTLLHFTGSPGEHGPHGITLGPDGMLYVVIGNHSQLVESIDSTSPYRTPYEGDLIRRYEDPGGHAAGIKAPGGTVIRVSLDGEVRHRVAGGLRNAYDLMFDAQGDLVLHDSDMESDLGTSWYRPTRIYHVPDGAELGWRSGWAKFPEYFLDQVPPVASTGRGSPAGGILYQHLAFPPRYQNALFVADWSEGRILAISQRPSGAGFAAQPETFLSGKPLNVVDLDVGEDGALYFCTGGRQTTGGVYRVVWNGELPADAMTFQSDLDRVIRHPQPESAWARQNLAKLRQRMGDEWLSAMKNVMFDAAQPAEWRIRALNCLVLYGPFPQPEWLARLAADDDYRIRSRVAFLCGLKADSSVQLDVLHHLLTDPHSRVRRRACESLIRLGETASLEELESMLTSDDRIENGVARRMLERLPRDEWETAALDSENPRIFVHAALAAITAHPEVELSYRILARISELMDGFVNDRDFLDMLRVTELALVQGQVDPGVIPAFVDRMKNEFPAGNGVINRELARILAYLKGGSLEGRLSDYLANHPDSETDKLHVAMYLQTIGDRLESDERLALLDYLEQARLADGGGSYRLYVERAIGDLCQSVTPFELNQVVAQADRWPTAMVALFRDLPVQLDESLRQSLIEADQRAATEMEDFKIRQMRLGFIAILARSGDPESMAYLREIWEAEVDRRGDIAIGLAQQPAGENWPYLVSSLPALDDKTCVEILDQLASVNRRPRDPIHFREVIQLGFRMRDEGARQAAALLEHWAGQPILTISEDAAEKDWQTIMQECRNWFESQWPDASPITIEAEPAAGRYSLDDLLGYLESAPAGDPLKGQQVYQRAQCAQCHRHGSSGQSAGPDLTSIASRFSRRELAESILHPSRVISDQYAASTILTVRGETLTGLAVPEGAGAYTLITASGERVQLAADEIEAIRPSETSAMPENLLDPFELNEIADLFEFLEKGAPRLTEAESPTRHE